VDQRRTLVPIVLALAAGCTAPLPGAPREWFALSGTVFRPEGPADSEYDDALGWTLAGGLDLNADRVGIAWELEGGWSQHDLATGGQPIENDVDVSRIATGVRIHSQLEEVPLGIYLRGGFEWRDESSDSGLRAGTDQLGSYFGAGLEWWYSPYAALGPCAGWFWGEHGDLVESRVGIAVRFY
jgi:hypothetical protein